MLVCIFCANCAYALGQNDAFKQGIQFAMNNHDKSVSALKAYSPKETIKNYSENPNETNYKEFGDDIKTKAREYVQNDDVGKNIITGSKNRNEKYNYSKDPNAPLIKNVLSKSDAIYDVVTGQYGDCTKKTSCTTTYKNEVCAEVPASMIQYCGKKLEVVMVPKQYVTHYTLTATLSVDEHNYAGVTVNSVTGKIGFLGPHDASFNMSGRLPADVSCSSLQGKITSETKQSKLDTVEFPSCANGLSLSFHISGGHSKKIIVDMTSTKIVPEPEDHWVDGCDGLSHYPNCTLNSDRCIEENTTHKIEGTDVKRACWQRELSYQCGSGKGVSQCQPLREQGCEQTGSICKTKVNDTCTSYEQSFQCPVKQCTDVGMICNGETYCLDGNCVNQQKNPDPDFQRSVSALSVASEAAKSFSNFNSVFTGQRKTCSKVFLGFIDCCADEGWGKDIHLAQCSPEEKDLAASKENLQTVYLGEYCNKDELGVCVEHRKAYCVFPSKLARIIQVQGRRSQLNIGFGDPEHADCRGLTREEFVTLNLGKMDFSDFYADIAKKQKIEDGTQLSKRVNDKVHDMEQENKHHA